MRIDTTHSQGLVGVLMGGCWKTFMDQVSSLDSTLADLKLPCVVCIGTEKSGKSTTMNRVAHRNIFPTADDYCTKMPIKRTLITPHPCVTFHPRLECHLRSRFPVARLRPDVSCLLPAVRMENALRSGRPSRCTIRFPGKPDEVLDLDAAEASEPAERIRLCMNKLVREHGEEVVTQELEVELCSPDVPNLEVIDLPGIVAGSSPLAQATVELTRSYIQRPNALVLCMVLAATPSLRNQAMALVEEAPGAKARTIVALTMW